MNEQIKAARKQLGSFFKQRREEMGISPETLSEHLGITANTLRGVESGRFQWEIDLHLKICQALGIKPYFSVTQDSDGEDYTLRMEDDPERYHGFYISENLMLYPDQLAIVKLTHPRLFLRFNYGESYFASYEDWKANHTDVQWLDADDRPYTADEEDAILTDCWNFLALNEREEDRLNDETDEYE